MHVIFDSPDRQCLHLIFSRDAAEIWVKALLQFRRNQLAPLLRAKHAMHQTTNKRVHGSSPLPSLTGLAALMLIYPAINRWAIFVSPCGNEFYSAYLQNIQLNDVFISLAQTIKRRLRRRLVQIDARDGSFGAFEDDVLHLLHVDVFGFDSVEDLRQDTGTVAMTHD